jgi:selenocysteine-specific elongation factor
VTRAGRVIGTAGHIDHGKTSLVRALTGIDTDRLKEEKERGITIELGFAHLDLAAEGVADPVGVVDVPGHERFVRTMVAGAVGIDMVVLVVAADEGVMPQTREHLDICRLLGLTRGVVALTKSDLAGAELSELAAEDVRAALAGTFLEKAPIIPCSSVTGEGLPALRKAIAEALAEAPAKDPEGLLRLPLDRVFSMKGFGTVVTGTLWAGRLTVGDDVTALPGGASGKVRGVQVHGAAVGEARAGQRTACNLSMARESLARGETLVRTGSLEAGKLLDVRIRYLATSRAPLRRRSRVMAHLGTAQVLATIALLDRGELEPGGEALGQLHLDEPLVALPGDRFILRGFALQKEHRTTIGGGTVLRVLGQRHRRGTPEVVAASKSAEADAANATARVGLEVRWAGIAGIARDALQMRVPQSPKETEAALTKLLAARTVVRFDKERGGVIHADALAALRARAQSAVEAYHAAEPLKPGMGREELRSKLPPSVGPRIFHLVVESLLESGALVGDRETVRRPGHDVRASQEQKGITPLAERVAARYREAALSPPRPAELVVALGADAAAVKEAIDLLTRGGGLVKVQDLHFDRAAVDDLRARLRAFLAERGQITPQEWKEMVGATRKFAIPLAEHFDGEKVTLRVGEVRKLRR